jgi:hypothetical protein
MANGASAKQTRVYKVSDVSRLHNVSNILRHRDSRINRGSRESMISTENRENRSASRERSARWVVLPLRGVFRRRVVKRESALRVSGKVGLVESVGKWV